ncbi:MAG: hypothetical protein LH467_12825 [Gemmatimonadaceae bacterium]|nr:hypothetical protein [Gemmatimonadaceae bacterium]
MLLARVVIAALSVVVWGYGYRVDDSRIRLVGIVGLAIALLLRFVPRRWLETRDERLH